MITATLDVNSADRLKIAIKLFTEGLGKEIAPFLKDTGKKLSLQFIESTPPFGTTNASKKMGENAAKRDLLRTITPASVVWDKKNTETKLFKRIKEVTQKKDKVALEAIMKNTPQFNNWKVKDFDKDIHIRNRKYGGRYRVPRSLNNVTMDETEYKNWEKEIVGRVGYQKASWGKIAAQLGGRTKGWISRHFGYVKAGIIDKTDHPTMPTLFLVNRTSGLMRHVTSYNVSVGVVADRMLRDLAYKVGYLAKQQKLKQ